MLDIYAQMVYTADVKLALHQVECKMNKFVENQIKKYRTRLGLTQKELADMVGVSRQSVISIEQGRYVPSLPLALKFARIFDCATDELFQLLEDV